MNPPADGISIDTEIAVEPWVPDPSTGVAVRLERFTAHLPGSGEDRPHEQAVLVVEVDPEGGDDYQVRFRVDARWAAAVIPHLLDVVAAEASPYYRPDLVALRQLVATHTGWLFDHDGDGGVEEPF